MNRENLKSSITDEDQRSYIKFCILANKSAADIHRELVNMIGSMAYFAVAVRKWVQRFNEGRTETKNIPKPGAPINVRTEKRIDELKKLLEENDTWPLKVLGPKLRCSPENVRRTLSDDLKKKKLLDSWVPHQLDENQKEMRVHICELNLFRLSNSRGMLKRIIAIDESWAPVYILPPRHQCRHWVSAGQQPAATPMPELHEQKALLIVGMDFDGVAFWSLFDEGVTMTSDRYSTFLDENVTKWQLDKKSYPIILHDNARPHKAQIIKDLLKSKSWSALPHPPYSPDLNPCDYNCFGNLKMRLSGVRYPDIDSLKLAINDKIRVMNESG